MNKNISLLKLFVVLGYSFLLSCASSEVASGNKEITMSYSRLQILDLDQMSELMQQKVKEFKKTNAVEPLQQGLEICLSRPDEDGMLEKVISIIKNPLDDNAAWESSVEALVEKSISNLKNKGVHPSDQVTSGVMLENILSEFKPLFMRQYESPGFETRIIEQIAKADIEYSKAALSERKLNLMRSNSSPSAVAQRLVEIRTESLKHKSKK